jgi:glutaredoxin
MEEAKVTLYTSSTCAECKRAAGILDALGIPYIERVIDLDPEAQTDALMLKIVRVPAVEIGGEVLRVPVEELAAQITTFLVTRDSCHIVRRR